MHRYHCCELLSNFVSLQSHYNFGIIFVVILIKKHYETYYKKDV